MHFSGWCCTTNDLTQLKSAKIARGEVIWDISFTPPSLRCYWKLQTSLPSPFAYFMELFMTDQLITIFYKVTFWISLIPLVSEKPKNIVNLFHLKRRLVASLIDILISWYSEIKSFYVAVKYALKKFPSSILPFPQNALKQTLSLEDSFNIISRGAFSRQKYQKFSEEIQLLETWRVNRADI